jgi:aquaporin Z
MLIGCTYLAGSVSGAHFNPSVTLAVLLRTLFGATHDAFSLGSAKYYPVVQCLGAFFGAWAAVDTVGDFQQIGYPMVHLDADGSADHMQALLAELLASFMLCYVILNVTTTRQLAGNSFFGVGIGGAAMVLTIAIGNVSGGALNPAVGPISPGRQGHSRTTLYISLVALHAKYTGRRRSDCNVRAQA